MASTHFNYVWLLPLLERSRESVEADLQLSIDALGLKSPLSASEVSLREVLATAISGSDYWAALAANWFEAGFPLDAALVDKIDAGVNAKIWSQHTRHRLYRVARQSGRT